MKVCEIARACVCLSVCVSVWFIQQLKVTMMTRASVVTRQRCARESLRTNRAQTNPGARLRVNEANFVDVCVCVVSEISGYMLHDSCTVIE